MAGPSFDTICNASLISYDYLNLSAAIPENNNITAFQVDFKFGGHRTVAEYSTVNFTVLFKPDAACVGNFVHRWCSMRLARVDYPIIISSSTAVLQPWQPSRNETIQLIRFSTTSDGWLASVPGLWIPGTAVRGLESMLGGIVYASRSFYKSYVNFCLPSKKSFLANVTGQAATNYLTSDISSFTNSSYTTPQELPATSTRVITSYRTCYEYLGISIGLMLLEGVVIVFLLWGWRGLGRDMSLDAFEIGRALGSKK
ncbi:hypothetical protein F4679DRAFT_588277 [Xylaria curta]|nr:hypothetical protein F4679DRAFT_588277 [Xylaria curta]